MQIIVNCPSSMCLYYIVEHPNISVKNTIENLDALNRKMKSILNCFDIGICFCQAQFWTISVVIELREPYDKYWAHATLLDPGLPKP